MARILILFAHPRFEQSRAQAALVRHIPADPRVTFHDLYQAYPDFYVDVEAEKALLLAHDIIVWQHPLYWYSAPPLLKQWIDLVLDFGWAYGPGGDKLRDKWLFQAFTSGGGRDRYQAEGRNRYTIGEFLRPFEQTARLCQMRYFPPYGLLGTHRFSAETCNFLGQEYGQWLRLLLDEQVDPSQWEQHEFVNDYLATFQAS